MRLLERQIREPELRFSDGELVACRAPYGQGLLVHLAGAGKIPLIKQQMPKVVQNIGGRVSIAILLLNSKGFFQRLVGSRKVSPQPVDAREVVHCQGRSSGIRGFPC